MNEISQTPPNNEQVFFAIRHRLKKGTRNLQQYERWLSKIMPIAASFPGHLGVQVVRPPDGHNEYLIVVRFAGIQALEFWQQSAERQQLLQEITGILDSEEAIDIKTGIDYWFTPPAVGKHPRRWKQWLVTTSVIWPLTMYVPPAMEPLFVKYPQLGEFGIRQGVLALVIVGLVVYLIMPLYVRLIAKWFFKS
ncbi:antibiotic biosynthesis monooxygenase [Methylomonas sp. MK1]|uniref:antibiotic biosynthesis monooxygenase n=1 Tax=Methylomonas sp. MK1 TaxID=1131552 RepID=UPI00037DD5F2|nr:antibiotic biosynthesis monooxygenase [Methylomonas sp. MK1]